METHSPKEEALKQHTVYTRNYGKLISISTLLVYNLPPSNVKYNTELKHMVRCKWRGVMRGAFAHEQ